MSVWDKSWKYRPFSETAKPGYLKRRFDAIRKQQREEAEAQAKSANVRPIKKAAK